MILDDILKILKSNSNSIAYRIGENKYTYKQLYKYVCNIYHFLLENNKNKKPVVVYGAKEIYMKASFLACSFAGIPYVPIDVNIPQDRIKSIINQVNPNIIIGDIDSNFNSISKNTIYNIMENESYNNIDNIYLKPEDTYYIIFTSGTTGQPKGVDVTYSNLNSCINWLKEITSANKEIILNQANFSFDLSVADLYLSLITESEHFILSTNSMMDFSTIFSELKKSNATIAVMTPSFADLLMTDDSFSEKLLPNLRKIIFCGEKLSFVIPKDIEGVIPVGKSKSDCEIFILDENKKEMPDGTKGEILITGESIAKGYINFKSDKFIRFKGRKAYLTGDVGYLKNGTLYVDGRKDTQIKYKGYRIELKDIESNITNLVDIEKVVVIPKKDENGKVEMIIAFIKTKSKTELEIRKELKKRLPSYMIPKIEIIQKFPINKNGKCDDKKLLEECCG